MRRVLGQLLAMMIIIFTACSSISSEESGSRKKINNSDEKYTNRELILKMQASLTSEKEHFYEEIHSFMKKKYQETAEQKENDVPKLPNLEIAQVASKRFGITTNEANEIFLNMEASMSP
ncbi:hypothetical protein [Bacillus massilinigeriensis]|uniref:hypothetical protein n=1 Tax=Bacillus massilionigeriensis TaxID=1805475 RepID=UPI00096B1F2E|nr:hypothetical protein [Bacillus massilionigeriensis]